MRKILTIVLALIVMCLTSCQDLDGIYERLDAIESNVGDLQRVTPTGIALLNVSPVYLTEGASATVEFRVNPSNATFDLCQIVLDKVGTVESRSSYITPPMPISWSVSSR